MERVEKTSAMSMLVGWRFRDMNVQPELKLMESVTVGGGLGGGGGGDGDGGGGLGGGGDGE